MKKQKQPQYANLTLHPQPDLRPSIGDSWKLLVGYPRVATAEELKSFDAHLTQDADQPVSLYKYTRYHRDTTITQLFTPNHTYVGGGEYTTQANEVHTVSDEEMSQLNAVGNF